MNVHTKTLTRKQAVSIIAGKIFVATNEQLERMLGAVEDIDESSNFVIIDNLLIEDNSVKINLDRKDIYG